MANKCLLLGVGQSIPGPLLVRLCKTPVSYLATPHKNAFAQTAHQTKIFHVKRFCPIGAENLTNWRHDQAASRPPQSGGTIAMSEIHALIVRPTD
jgi:hypothetical protein